MADAHWSVVEVSAADTYSLRMAVLRDNTPTKDPRYSADTKPGTIHLGIYDQDELIGTSTWMLDAWQADPHAIAVKLRGMAVAKRHQNVGVGSLLLDAGVAHAKRLGAQYVWAKARDTALAFYLRHDFVVVGEGFIANDTQLPHHLVVRHLITV